MTDEPRTRPRDRRSAILDVASTEFHRRGYAGTSLDDIAARLGITAPALYRHFRGKDALYTAVLERHLRQLEEVVSGADSPTAASRGLAEVGVDHPALGMLWNPDRRRRLQDPQGELERRLAHVGERLGTLLGEGSAELGAVRSRAVLAAVSSTGFYASPLEREIHIEALGRAIDAVIVFRPSGPWERVVRRHEDGPRPWSTRRTALIDACAALVTERGGIAAVTIEEIGAAARVPATTVYQLFESKAGLLAAALARAANGAMAVLQRASSQASTADEALDLAIASAAELSAEHPAWSSVLSDEVANLPEEPRAQVAGIVAEYLDEWLALCVAVAPGHGAETVRIRMRAALAILDDRPSHGPLVDVLGIGDTTVLFRRVLGA